jgi:hypothetical protein
VVCWGGGGGVGRERTECNFNVWVDVSTDGGRAIDRVGLAAAVLHIERLHDGEEDADLNAPVYHYIALYYTIPNHGTAGIRVLA